jgi:hypothetical protein
MARKDIYHLDGMRLEVEFPARDRHDSIEDVHDTQDAFSHFIIEHVQAHDSVYAAPEINEHLESHIGTEAQLEHILDQWAKTVEHGVTKSFHPPDVVEWVLHDDKTVVRLLPE